jgi:cellulase
MSKFAQIGLLAALIASVAGHTQVEKFEAGGKTYDGYRQGTKKDPGNQSPAWWTGQGWGLQPVYGSKLSHPYVSSSIPPPMSIC